VKIQLRSEAFNGCGMSLLTDIPQNRSLNPDIESDCQSRTISMVCVSVELGPYHIAHNFAPIAWSLSR
jgi:hypothetical protein